MKLMFEEIKSVAERSKSTLLSDALGVTSLVVLLFAALHYPSF